MENIGSIDLFSDGPTSVFMVFNSMRPSDACMRRYLSIIGSDNGLSPGRRQAIIWNSVGILLIGPLRTTNFSEILIGIHTFPFKKIYLKMASGKWRPFCRGRNVLSLDSCWAYWPIDTPTAVWCSTLWVTTLRPDKNSRFFPDGTVFFV